jgi:hypothetical protein
MVTTLDLVRTMTALLAAGLHYDPRQLTPSLLSPQKLEPFVLRGMNDECAASVAVKAVESMHQRRPQQLLKTGPSTSPQHFSMRCFLSVVLPESVKLLSTAPVFDELLT